VVKGAVAKRKKFAIPFYDGGGAMMIDRFPPSSFVFLLISWILRTNKGKDRDLFEMVG